MKISGFSGGVLSGSKLQNKPVSHLPFPTESTGEALVIWFSQKYVPKFMTGTLTIADPRWVNTTGKLRQAPMRSKVKGPDPDDSVGFMSSRWQFSRYSLFSNVRKIYSISKNYKNQQLEIANRNNRQYICNSLPPFTSNDEIISVIRTWRRIRN